VLLNCIAVARVDSDRLLHAFLLHDIVLAWYMILWPHICLFVCHKLEFVRMAKDVITQSVSRDCLRTQISWWNKFQWDGPQWGTNTCWVGKNCDLYRIELIYGSIKLNLSGKLFITNCSKYQYLHWDMGGQLKQFYFCKCQFMWMLFMFVFV